MPAYHWVCHRCNRSNAAGTEVYGHCFPASGQPEAARPPATQAPTARAASASIGRQAPAKEPSAWTRMTNRFDEYERVPRWLAYTGLGLAALGVQVFLFIEGWAGTGAGLGLVVGGVALIAWASHLNGHG